VNQESTVKTSSPCCEQARNYTQPTVSVYTLEATEAEFNLSLLQVRDNKHALAQCFQDEGRSMGASNYCHHAPPCSCQQSNPSPTLCNTLCRAQTIQTQPLRRKIHYYFEPSETFWFSTYLLTSCFSAILTSTKCKFTSQDGYNGQVRDRPRTGREGCYSQPHRYIIFATTCAMDLSPTQPNKFVTRPIPLGIKQPKREAVNLLPLVPR